MARTGLRIGEALALTWDDIDFEEYTIKVRV
ncbi:tyrosine-type recombinase/integrase [Bacillus subtilis]|nr:tyrosine-type recombinase/integrase [Bacillus subtilis]MED3696058.1 tyrosine-type recombinase/integrase [Bacillus subtilis]